MFELLISNGRAVLHDNLINILSARKHKFPNGRWGDSTSPAFGDLSEISHFYSFTLGSDDDRRAMLGK